jgi:hypothetical protein
MVGRSVGRRPPSGSVGAAWSARKAVHSRWLLWSDFCMVPISAWFSRPPNGMVPTVIMGAPPVMSRNVVSYQ